MLALVLTFTSLFAAQSPPPSGGDVIRDPIRGSMYGVVLLVTDKGNGVAGFGTGIVLDKKGNVLTNLHVLDGAKSVRALAYDPSRPSYAAVDGGLPRLVFEREKELVPVTIVRGDPVLDLAIARMETPARVVVLPIASSELAIGETVTALGHGEQNFWTASMGHVSGVHQGFIQHDAAVNKGNSGGPLVNARGEVVGINTLFLKGAPGISYARPISLASRLVDIARAPLVMDRSTPQKAIESCNHARELGDPAYAQCVNWGSAYAAFRDEVNDILDNKSGYLFYGPFEGKGGPKSRARKVLREWLEKGDGRADLWVTQYGPLALTFELSDDAAATGRAMDRFLEYVQNGTRGGKPPAKGFVKKSRRIQVASVNPETGAIDDAFFGATGFKGSLADVALVRKTMKMGLRVDNVVMSGTDHAWASLTGLNLDGTPYRYSNLLVKAPDGWRVCDCDYTNRPKPKNFPPALAFDELPFFLMMMSSLHRLAEFVVLDPPDGVAVNEDYEHNWPAYLDDIKNGRAIMGPDARSLTELLFKDAAKKR